MLSLGLQLPANQCKIVQKGLSQFPNVQRDVLSSEPKDIQFTVIENRKKQQSFTLEKLEAENVFGNFC